MARLAPEYERVCESGYADNLEYLLDEFRRLDLLIHLRLLGNQGRRTRGPLDQFKGLVLLEDEILQLVAGAGQEPSEQSADTSNDAKTRVLAQTLRHLEGEIELRRAASLSNRVNILLPRLAQFFGLSSFEQDCLLVCLAPEIDRKYEKLYAYLHDDVTQKRPSVDLLLGLLCETTEKKLAARGVFDQQSPLLKYRLLQVTDGSAGGSSPLLSRSLKLDDRVVSFLLGSEQVDVRLQHAARLVSAEPEPESSVVSAEHRSLVLEYLNSHPGATQTPGVVFYFCGPYGTGKRSLATLVCQDLGTPLISCDLTKLPTSEVPFDELMWLFGRERLMHGAALCLENCDDLLADADKHLLELKSIIETIRAFPSLTFLLGSRPWRPRELSSDDVFIQIDFPAPNYKTRKQLWEANLTPDVQAADGVRCDALADRFKLTAGQIKDAMLTARTAARWRSPRDVRMTMADLDAACRAQFTPKLGELARKIEPRLTWQDIVLPPDGLAQLKEVCNQSRHRRTVYGEWGFDRKLSLGRGLTALFTGPPGTGKTMAAEVIAGELQLDLYKIDLSQVVSKYIGETEKNLHRIFDEAESSSSILFFDEADALFGKRSEVKDAHDRYANIEVGYLLQKMEEYDGIAILATNLRQNLDDAFTRRMRFIVEFPFPDEQYRRLIWQVTFPPEAPLAADVDFAWLAREIKLAGGNIKNIALAAAFLAAEEGEPICLSHLTRAARREFQKIGRTWSEGQPVAQ